MSVSGELLTDLKARGLVHQLTADAELEAHLEKSRGVYCGFDPTADSLHIGSLVPLLMLRRFQEAGHVPIALVGGATGLIGDPSFKAQERKLNTEETVVSWVERLKTQVSRFVSFDGTNAAKVVNNLDWTQDQTVLSFLRDVGKHFSVNSMIQKESVKQRIDRDGEGISFTEFTYMLLQSYDFAELNKRLDCSIQIGGSDQWGNITGGIDLTRRMNQKKVFGLTMPLVTKSDGTKFGKTESGTIWLDANKTSPYAFYQFWLNTADADVYQYLKYFTFLTVEQIDQIEKEDRSRQGKPQAQQILAEEVTRLVHGDDGLVAANNITQALFSGDVSMLAESDFNQLALDGLSVKLLSVEEVTSKTIMQVCVELGLAQSGKQVKDALNREALFINGTALSSESDLELANLFACEKAYHNHFFLVKVGKKKHGLIKI